MVVGRRQCLAVLLPVVSPLPASLAPPAFPASFAPELFLPVLPSEAIGAHTGFGGGGFAASTRALAAFAGVARAEKSSPISRSTVLSLRAGAIFTVDPATMVPASRAAASPAGPATSRAEWGTFRSYGAVALPNLATWKPRLANWSAVVLARPPRAVALRTFKVTAAGCGSGASVP